jgi:hypothetical protein
MALTVSTPSGVYERVVPRATALRHHDPRGAVSETAVQDAAATWGCPIYRITQGSGGPGRIGLTLTYG